ncbi:hypothetical protein QFW96_01135 [Saccharopolyspora sp. TS4A08]|uniref:DUF4262 domain-containing protein n=1 Tax=Saccharopolyspora ipomoeae TaxID=3042027 RepID=A0ABT6PGW1_9PSEU|nr:hypothetical protein [Saccharopolyspora sp. TS4A08]MDI2027187.1 hypothetical protein [Saccharopolyspora sp. TS4A08]
MSSEVDAQLDEMRKNGWESYVFGPRDDPNAVGLAYRWKTCADVLVLHAEDDATAYRMPLGPDADLFAPRIVSWHYHAPAEWTIRALLSLPRPGAPDAPLAMLTPPPDCAVPAQLRRTMTIRPNPRRAHVST